ncbi:AAA family ATPase [Promicromonospora iranensis]|uniref:ATPase n=1 Tax=Promicromonospora iranensis TaxID=1105144 RepID=A0ABU2CMS8_9MICO|nr:AAA family ATPase [Promicromonospora iranensis]MDR7382627.1 putative ATPase [Promicromonospora iranensis]
MLIERVSVKPAHVEEGAWPWTVPAVADLTAHGMRLTSSIVILVGANGSGKSTVLEAIAETYGLDVRGGHGGRKYASGMETSPLGEALFLDRTLAGTRMTRQNAKGFYLRAETAFGMLAFMTEAGVTGYGDRLSSEVSHGESYLQAIAGRFSGPGLYLLDEAEGPLSFESTLQLLYRLQDLVNEHAAQVIYATHSPLVAALPGAQILEMTEDGIAERTWSELESVNLWKRFLGRPDTFFDVP